VNWFVLEEPLAVKVAVSLYNAVVEHAVKEILKKFKEKVALIEEPKEGEVLLLDKMTLPKFDLWRLSDSGVYSLLIDTGLEEEEFLFIVSNFPVSGVVHADMDPKLFPKCLEAVAQGEKWFKRELLSLISSRKEFLKVSTLTDREKAVIALLIKGKTNKEIARALGLSEQTIKYYINQLLKKTNCPNRVGLVKLFSKVAYLFLNEELK